MASIILPPDTKGFRCVRGFELPQVCSPAGKEHIIKKLFAPGYFSSWEKDPDPIHRLYVGSAVKSRVVSVLEPVVIAEAPKKLVVYCWEAMAPVTWEWVYQHFPMHGLRPADYQVVPWFHLRNLVFGWPGSGQSVIPKNDRGALFWLGDAGVNKITATGTRIRGTEKWLVQIGYSAMVSSPIWNLVLPEQQGNNRDDCPVGTAFLTVASG